jgi:hypothetical protein
VIESRSARDGRVERASRADQSAFKAATPVGEGMVRGGEVDLYVLSATVLPAASWTSARGVWTLRRHPLRI